MSSHEGAIGQYVEKEPAFATRAHERGHRNPEIETPGPLPPPLRRQRQRRRRRRLRRRRRQRRRPRRRQRRRRRPGRRRRRRRIRLVVVAFLAPKVFRQPASKRRPARQGRRAHKQAPTDPTSRRARKQAPAGPSGLAGPQASTGRPDGPAGPQACAGRPDRAGGPASKHRPTRRAGGPASKRWPARPGDAGVPDCPGHDKRARARRAWNAVGPRAVLPPLRDRANEAGVSVKRLRASHPRSPREENDADRGGPSPQSPLAKRLARQKRDRQGSRSPGPTQRSTARSETTEEVSFTDLGSAS